MTCRGMGQINNYIKDKGWQVSHRQSYQRGNRKRKRNLVMNENWKYQHELMVSDRLRSQKQ